MYEIWFICNPAIRRKQANRNFLSTLEKYRRHLIVRATKSCAIFILISVCCLRPMSLYEYDIHLQFDFFKR